MIERLLSDSLVHELIGKYIFLEMKLKKKYFLYIDSVSVSGSILGCVDSESKLTETILKGI